MQRGRSTGARVLIAAGLLTLLTACSGGGNATPSLPGTSLQGSGMTPDILKGNPRRMTTGTIYGSVAFQAPIVAGSPTVMTINLSASNYPQDYPVAFNYNLPTNAVGNFNVAPNPSASITCAGLTWSPALVGGAKNVQVVPSTPVVQLSGPCTLSVSVVASAPGSYQDNVGAVWGGESTQTFVWESPLVSTGNVTVNPAMTHHIYEPVYSSSGQGSVAVFAEGTNAQPICSISAGTIPNPIAVAVNPSNGWIYVLDKSQTVTGFLALSGSTCPSAPQATWSVPAAATSLTVDSHNDVVVATCAAIYWYAPAGTLVHTYAAPAGSCFSEVSANYSNQTLYASDIDADWVWEFNTSPASPTVMCGVWADFISGGDLNGALSPSELAANWRIAAGPNGSFFSSSRWIGGSVPHLSVQTDVATNTDCTQASTSFVWPTALSTVAFDPASMELTGGLTPGGLREYSIPSFSPLTQLPAAGVGGAPGSTVRIGYGW